MTETQNLHLPQWEAEDRIMRTDFNAAFAALDTAVKNNADAIAAKAGAADLTAEIAARQATDTAVDKLGAKLLLDYTYSGSAATVEVNVSSIDWKQWHSVTIQFVPITNTASGASYVCIGGSDTGDRIGTCRTQTSGGIYTAVILLYPLFSNTGRIASYSLSPEYNGAYYASERFSNCRKLYLTVNNSGVQFVNGTKLKIWGCR